ncbi:MAG: hypothetical protein ACI88G_001361, partial [Woeseiaceae bacterium]
MHVSVCGGTVHFTDRWHPFVINAALIHRMKRAFLDSSGPIYNS